MESSGRGGQRGATGRSSRAERARMRRVHRRRRAGAAVIGLFALLALVVGARSGAGGGSGAGPAEQAESEPIPELPGGGTELLPARRLVGTYGAPQDPQLGDLGIGEPSEAGERLLEQAAAYDSDPERPVLPFMELIAVIAAADPGEDGQYRNRQPRRVIERYLAAAREIDALFVLDIQPGLADFTTETKRLRRYLREPDVGLALDPEWAMEPGEIPGQVIGSVDAAEVNRVSRLLSKLIERENLPQKPLIVHQFTPDMIVGKDRLREYPGVALVLNVDGFGDKANKVAKYEELATDRRSPFFDGFKLFYEEDVGLMSPREVDSLRPQPDVVLYE